MQSLTVLGLTAALLAASPSATAATGVASPVAVTVSFSPVLERRLSDSYGERERDALRAIVVDSVGRAVDRRARRTPVAVELNVEVVLADALPSHPTRRQGLENPSIDPIRSRSLGGADVAGTVRNSAGQVVATVSYGYFAPDLMIASSGGDAWADARIAIDRFADQLAARLPGAR